MDRRIETIVEAFQAVPLGLEVLRMKDVADPGSFYPVAVNQAACDILKQDMKADLGKTWHETAPELAESDFASMFVSALRERAPVSWELEYGDARFDKNWWRGTATPLDERTIVVVFQNVTSEKESQRELERSNRALDDFAYVASHDLRAPLRDIDNLATWISEDLQDVPASTARHLATMRQRVGRMENLLGDLLEYSRAGRIYGPPERLYLKQVCAAVQGLLPAGEGFTTSFPDVDLELHTPRQPLEQVLRNLVSNAIKHHHRDHGRVEVGVDVGPSMLTFHVQDDGPGIAPEFHARIFGMFQTLRPRDEIEGTGMGLALCKKLVEAHGGSIWLRSQLGRGSTFSFSWPREWKRREGDGG